MRQRVPRVLVGIAGVLLHEVVAVLLAAVDADDHALRAELGGELAEQLGIFERGGVERNLVGAAVQQPAGVVERADAAGHAEGNVDHAGDARHPVGGHGAAVAAGGDVVEHEFIGAFVAVALGEFDDVAHDHVIAELDALDDLAVAHVEAGNDAAG